MRKFKTGSTRDDDSDKLDYSGFFSPLVRKRRAEYMHKHRLQSDGKLRASDNWKLGLPIEESYKSLERHFTDLALIMDGYPQEAREDIENALCAIMFNAESILLEKLKENEKR